MKTSQGFIYTIDKRNILHLKIPKNLGTFSAKVQEARKEICLNPDIYFTEIRTVKI